MSVPWMSSGRKASKEEIVWDDLVLPVRTIICPDRAGIEQENLFTKLTARAKQSKLTSRFLGHRNSLQEHCTKVEFIDRSFCLFKKENNGIIELIWYFQSVCKVYIFKNNHLHYEVCDIMKDSINHFLNCPSYICEKKL